MDQVPDRNRIRSTFKIKKEEEEEEEKKEGKVSGASPRLQIACMCPQSLAVHSQCRRNRQELSERYNICARCMYTLYGMRPVHATRLDVNGWNTPRMPFSLACLSCFVIPEMPVSGTVDSSIENPGGRRDARMRHEAMLRAQMSVGWQPAFGQEVPESFVSNSTTEYYRQN